MALTYKPNRSVRYVMMELAPRVSAVVVWRGNGFVEYWTEDEGEPVLRNERTGRWFRLKAL